MKHFEPYIEYRRAPVEVAIATPEGGEVSIKIAAGSSFGARHDTTRLCLRGLEAIFLERKIGSVLDFGCGSGILSIASAILGAERILAIDLDPIAVEEARKNSINNGADGKIEVSLGSIEDVSGAFDLVVANIVTDELLRMRVDIASRVKSSGGGLLVSGIAEVKKEAVAEGFQPLGLRREREFLGNGWACIWFTAIEA
ncbi:MAG: 50S ribosomal protein L11 methyltransferase [Deltaproteobacteria bacterium]